MTVFHTREWFKQWERGVSAAWQASDITGDIRKSFAGLQYGNRLPQKGCKTPLNCQSTIVFSA